MNQFDIQRVENALWTLEKYWENLQDTNADMCRDGVWFDTSDALRVLDLALDTLKEESK